MLQELLEDSGLSGRHSDTDYWLYVKAGKNNTIASLFDRNRVLQEIWSGGRCGVRKAKRGTSDIGFQVIQNLAARVSVRGMRPPQSLHVVFSGFGPGRDAAFRALRATDWKIAKITDNTPLKFGGCRAPKKRRL
ncbi:hypothetical protein CXG81DRAFT_12649 [Caulochytrium protostelioides]|uniref:Ribosomal protein S11 n=1 Tax=Caulochytrium protostelioides TaxID=1555241 RepID=A0A4P9X6V5_9FUNG|nr:hypothetical protein CXG81DRAFT_12649 [Caulochytrium protostelioides]|eukprot:RKP00918.1 hypothetical protein CXG81DRAFT_12649 [Caulochytrium protostelioides]